ncbi:MAG TPA: P-type DNA transfer protein VirB5 [Noviherbaspirillum sp.]|nr:P-type DNA transfer protein VirB5 [Noviherbaspirillum sp.]
MRKQFCLGITLFATIAVPAYGTGVPVMVTTDATAMANQIVNVSKYIEQINQLKSQLKQSKELFDNLNGLRNVGNLMKDELLKQYLPPEFQKAYQQLKSGKGGSLSGISGTLNEIVKAHQARNCSQYGTQAAQADCRATWQNHAMNQYVGEAGYEQAAKNIQNLEAFISKIQSSPDSKSLQDLQARIAVEQVKLQNEHMKLQTIAHMQKAQEDMRRQNSIDNTVKMLKPGMIRF